MQNGEQLTETIPKDQFFRKRSLDNENIYMTPLQRVLAQKLNIIENKDVEQIYISVFGLPSSKVFLMSVGLLSKLK